MPATRKNKKNVLPKQLPIKPIIIGAIAVVSVFVLFLLPKGAKPKPTTSNNAAQTSQTAPSKSAEDAKARDALRAQASQQLANQASSSETTSSTQSEGATYNLSGAKNQATQASQSQQGNAYVGNVNQNVDEQKLKDAVDRRLAEEMAKIKSDASKEYEARIRELEADIQAKQQTINSLRQTNSDLQQENYRLKNNQGQSPTNNDGTLVVPPGE